MQAIRIAVSSAREVEALTLPPQHCAPEQQAGFDYAFFGDHKVDIPSDGQFHTVSLKQAEVSSKLRHISVPRETMQVFRCATFVNPFDAPLLPGPVEVTSEGQYLTPGQVLLTPKGGEAEVWLGAEQRIKISRNSAFKEVTSGLLRGQLALEHSIAIDIVNHLESAADVEVRERIPVVKQRETDIKVDIKKVDPDWYPYEQREHPLRGGYLWRVSLSPGEKKQLLASYRVLIPAKHHLVGGNRREG
jgi:uncharacterized protein (TIGR02231 family)